MKICCPLKSYTCKQLILTFLTVYLLVIYFFLSSIFRFLAKLNHWNLLESSAWQVVMVAVHKKFDNFYLHTSYFLSNSVLYLYCWWLCIVVSSTDKMSSLLCNMLRIRPSCWYYLQSVICVFFLNYLIQRLCSLHKCIDR